MKWRRKIAVTALAGTAMMVLPIAVAGPASAASKPEVVAKELNGPGKLSFGPDGALYVSEAGMGGEPNATHSNCIPAGDEGAESCYGETGSVTKVDGDAQTRVVQGLPSLASEEGASGPADVAVGDDGTVYAVIGLGANPSERDSSGAPFTNLGTVFSKAPNATKPTLFADIAAFERDNDPDKDAPRDPQDTDPTTDSNPYAITMAPDGSLLVADAGGNDVVSVDNKGKVSLVTVLPYSQSDAPEFLGAPPGTKISTQPVPTSVEIDPNGGNGVLIGQLTGFPFPVGGANVFRVNDNADPQDNLDVEESGLTNIIDIAKAPDGTLYVLEFASNGLLSDNPTPALIQIRPDGSRKALLSSDDLSVPGGVAVDGDGMVYVSNCALCPPGAGTVIKVDPNVARDSATASACNPFVVPGTDFEDITQDFHRESIECLSFWGLLQGVTATEFNPLAQVTRGQAASVIARLMETAGFDLPANPPNAFSDDDANVHAHRIDQLAAVGVVNGFDDGTFRPNDPVSRGQLASLITGAYVRVTKTGAIAAPDAFSDDNGSVHEDAINFAAAQGWVNGIGDGKFNPNGIALRDQLASIVARTLSTLVDDGLATPPAAG